MRYRRCWCPELRRRAAIRLLVDSGDWPKNKLIPIKVLSGEHNDTEVSLAANLGRVDMHPADAFEAFRHLVEDGADPDAVAAVRTPIGIDIGAETPEEIAVAIMAEIIAVRRGKSSKKR